MDATVLDPVLVLSGYTRRVLDAGCGSVEGPALLLPGPDCRILTWRAIFLKSVSDGLCGFFGIGHMHTGRL